MTHTLRKRTGRTATHPPAARPDGPDARLDGCHDPADLADTLRRLALRAHRAVQAGKDGEAADAARRERDDLRSALARLETDCRSQGLDRLAPYVAALRRQVDSRLG